VKVKALIRFYDREADEIREAGKVFSVSEERCKQLSLLSFVEPMNEEKKPQKQAAE